MRNFSIRSAHCYYIAPFRVLDYSGFKSFLEAEKWETIQEPDDYDRHAINPINAEFLGLRPGGTKGFLQGEYYRHNYIKEDYSIFNNKKLKVAGRVVGEAEAVLENYLRIHLFPDSGVGILVFCFSVENTDSDTLIKLNYDLHKIDKYQSPKLLFPTGIDITKKKLYGEKDGFGTIGEMTRTLLGMSGNFVELLNHHRLRAATCIELAAQDLDNDSLEEMLPLIAMCFSVTYKLPSGIDKPRPKYLFDDILVSAFYEGMAVAMISSGSDTFSANFDAKFRDSYLPIYLMTNLSEAVIVANTNNAEAKDTKILEVLHKVKCFTKLPVSQYHHLVCLSEICSEAVYMPKRNDALVDYFEYQRLEHASVVAEQEKLRDEDAKFRSENLTYIALAFTVASITFPLVTFLGFTFFSDLPCWGKYIVAAVLTAVVLMIFWCIYRIIGKHKI